MNQHSSYRAEIDGLRAIAVLAVILFHALPRHFPGGFVGVDVFFVISGYLISKIIIGALAERRFDLLHFYTRRILRILPALLVVMAFTMLAGWLFLTENEVRSLGKNIFAGVSFISNFESWSEVGYFDAEADTKASLHLWSLAVEQQFYLIWPFMLALVFRRKLKLTWTIATLALLSFCWSTYLSLTDTTAAYYSPFSRFWELMAGALMTRCERRQADLPDSMRTLLGASGLALLLFSLFVISSATPFPGYGALAPVAGACLVIAGGTRAWTNRHILASRPMVGLGLISYPLYLWHWPIFTFARIFQLSRRFDIATAAALIFASLIAAWATYVFIEKPVRRAVLENRVAAKLGGAMAVILAASLAMYFAIIPPRNSDPSVQALIEASSDWDEALYLKRINEPVRHARLDSVGVKAETVYIGDSHTEQYRPRFAELYARKSPGRLANLVIVANGGCVPIPGVDNDSPEHRKCQATRDYAYQYVLRPEVKTVVIAACWNCYLTPSDEKGRAPGRAPYYTLIDGKKVYLTNSSGIDQAYKNLASLLRRLRSDFGKRVYLVLDNPSDPAFSPRTYFHRSATGELHAAALPEKLAINHEQALIKARLTALARAEGVTVLDPAPMICDEHSCRVHDREGRPLYRDDNHLRPFVVREKASFLDETLMSGTPDAARTD